MTTYPPATLVHNGNMKPRTLLIFAPLLLLVLCLSAVTTRAQMERAPNRNGTTLPVSCSNKNVLFHLTQTDGANLAGVYRCNGSIFVAVGGGASPSGADNQLQKKNGSAFSGSLFSDDGTNVIQSGTGYFKAPHFLGGSATPAIAAGAAAGASPTVSVVGTDSGGEITIVCANAAGVDGTLATITFANAYANAPSVVISPSNIAAANLVSGGGGAGVVYPNSTSTASFILSMRDSVLLVTTYKWSYIVVGR